MWLVSIFADALVPHRPVAVTYCPTPHGILETGQLASIEHDEALHKVAYRDVRHAVRQIKADGVIVQGGVEYGR